MIWYIPDNYYIKGKTAQASESFVRFDEVVILNEGRIEQIGAPQDESKGVLYVRPHDVEIESAGASEHEYALQARVLHIFSAGNYARVSLERVGTHEPFEAEVTRENLRRLRLQPGDTVSVVFRHVRLFEDGRYKEGDVRAGKFVPSATE